MQQRALETRQRLLRATAEAIDATGYDGASTTDILAAAGVTRGALYHHFDSKASLVRALIDEQFKPVTSPPQVAHAPVLHVAEITLEAVAALVGDVEFRAAFGVLIDRPRDDLDSIARPIGDWTTVFTEIFDLARDQETVLPDLNPAVEASLVLSHFIGQFCIARMSRDFALIFEPLAEFWRRFIQRAVQPPLAYDYRREFESLFAQYWPTR